MRHNIKFTVLILLLLFTAAVAVQAAVPQVIVYQGRLTDIDGVPVEDNDYLIKFTIYGSPAGTDELWGTEYQQVPVVNGLFSYRLGSNEPFPSDLFNSGGDFYLGIKVNVDAEIVPRTKFESSAFSMHSGHSDLSEIAVLAQDITCVGCISASEIDAGAVQNNQLDADAVTTDKIQDGTITFDDIGQNGSSANQIIKRNSSNTAWEIADDVGSHTGAIYRWNTFQTYSQTTGWLIGNDPSMFGGINPSQWTDGGATAVGMSSDMEVLRTIFTQKGYGGKNANVISDVFVQFSSTNGKVTLVLFRIKNTTESVISWSPRFYYSCYLGYGERASVALNGAIVWVSPATSSSSSFVEPAINIPASQTSTVIFVSTNGPPYTYNGFAVRDHKLAFGNNSLELPAGLEYVDDLDVATALLE